MSQLEATLTEALAWHEAFLRLGFDAEDLFLVNANGPDGVGVLLKSQGHSFVGFCGPTGGASSEEVHSLWLEKIATWNNPATPADVRARVWNSGFPARNATLLVTKLMAKGFTLPKVQS